MQHDISFSYMKTLPNGVQIPMIGLGTYKITTNQIMQDVLGCAYTAGYRHIDTASFYKNEQSIRLALKANHIPREHMFITSKVWGSDEGYDPALRAFEKTIANLGTDYLDLYLIHWPTEHFMETWMALERLYAEGRVRAIGVSNFTVEHLQKMVESNHIKPMVNQIEIHPGYPQVELCSYCKRHHIAITASAPLARGGVFNEPVCIDIAKRYHKTVSQIVLRWHYQLGIITVPKSVHADRIAQNIDIFDFTLDQHDMEALSFISGERLFSDP